MAVLPFNRILMIEDEKDIQTVAKLALESVGSFIVELCDSGQEAIHTALSFGPDLILLDVMMPGMDGLETLKALRGIPQLSTIPVIFMTAKVQPHEVAQYKKIGALDVISKPFDPMTLSQTVNFLWTQYHDKQCESKAV